MKTLLHVFASWRMAIILIMGFASGIPLGLTGGTLQAWMANEKIDLAVIGIFSLVGAPYSFKFLWAPFMDRYVPPLLGRRRGWIFVTQLALVASIAAMAFSNPAASPGVLAFLALLVSFSSASQDIVIDAYRTEVLHSDELGAGAGVHILGYRLAMLFSGAFALILADKLPWKMVYLIMALSVAVTLIFTFFAPEPEKKVVTPKSIKEAVIDPFVEFFKRKGSVEVVTFVTLYKVDVVMTLALLTPFLMEMGFTKTDIGVVTKGFGLVATIVGTLLGGAAMSKLGMLRSLWIFGLAQGLSGLSFTLLAHFGHNYSLMVTAITMENLCSGMGTAAYSAFLMSLCDRRFTATQYALLTSLMALSRTFIAAPMGYLVKGLGWQAYFIIATLVSIPGLLMLLRYSKWKMHTENTAA